MTSAARCARTVVKGGVLSPVFAANVPCTYLPFTWGFVNVEFGLGVALWSVAAYLMVADPAHGVLSSSTGFRHRRLFGRISFRWDLWRDARVL